MSSTAVIAPPSNRPDQAWPQSTLPSQLALGQGNAQLAGQSIAELTQICREQAEELEAKEVIITYLKRKLSSLEAAALTQQSLTPENQPPSSLPKKQAGSRKRSATEAASKECKAIKTQTSQFLKAASDEMKSCIKWDGVLQVQFTVPVAPHVFHKIFYNCQNYKAAPASNQEAGELVDDTSTVTLDREDIVNVFGEARAGRKFRYTGNGLVETLIVNYSPASTVAKGTGTWTFHG